MPASVLDATDVKRCTACGHHLGRCEFGRDRSRKDGLNNRCRSCDRERGRERYEREVGPLPTRQCIGCGVGLRGHKRQVCGKPACKRAYWAQRTRTPEQRARERKRERAPRKPNTECEICGELFVGRTSKGVRQRTCSRECGVRLRQEVTGTQCSKLHGQSSDVGWGSFALCSTVFQARGRRKTCPGAACRREFARRRYWPIRSCEPPPPASVIACDECGEQFAATSVARRFCSRRCCGRAHRRALRRRQRAEGRRNDGDRRQQQRRRQLLIRLGREGALFSLREIAERDGWTCHLCGLPVDEAAASMDHLVPLSEGGPHSRENVKLAHHLCNSVRGTLPLEEWWSIPPGQGLALVATITDRSPQTSPPPNA